MDAPWEYTTVTISYDPPLELREAHQVEPAKFFECRCRSDDHTLIFRLDPEEPEIYTSVLLDATWMPWYRRAWKALRYVFGRVETEGHFDCFLLRPEDAERLRALCDRLIELRDNQER